MRISHRIAAFCLGAGVIAAGLGIAASHGHAVILDSQGFIADQQRHLLYWVLALMALVVIPVFALTVHIIIKYRAGNDKATYAPEWDHNLKLESIWWGFPALIIGILSIIIWNTSHSLDPYKPIASDRPPLTIQVVALQWKWLFIYPDDDIATVNYVKFPANRPINFQVTADAPMNSFWIPQLGSQIYAMSGMRTSLQLLANHPGDFQGSSANLSGSGFADMHFDVSALTDATYNSWVRESQSSPSVLDYDAYNQLARPSRQAAADTYQLADRQLQNIILNKYAAHHGGSGQTDTPADVNSTFEDVFNESGVTF